MVGTKTDRPEHGRAAASRAGWTGSSTRASSGPPARASWSRAARSDVAIPPSRPRSTTSSRGSPKLADVQNVRSPLDAANAGQISADGRSALVEFEIRGAADKARRQGRPGPRPGRAAQEAHPQFFIGEFGDASAVNAVETAYGDDLGKAGHALAPDHAAHPRDRVRGARRRRHSAAARPDRGLRHLRPRRRRRATSLPMANEAARDRAPDRARGRRRLLALLPRREREERAAGTQRASCARGRRRHLGPLRARSPA